LPPRKLKMPPITVPVPNLSVIPFHSVEVKFVISAPVGCNPRWDTARSDSLWFQPRQWCLLRSWFHPSGWSCRRQEFLRLRSCRRLRRSSSWGACSRGAPVPGRVSEDPQPAAKAARAKHAEDHEIPLHFHSRLSMSELLSLARACGGIRQAIAPHPIESKVINPVVNPARRPSQTHYRHVEVSKNDHRSAHPC